MPVVLLFNTALGLKACAVLIGRTPTSYTLLEHSATVTAYLQAFGDEANRQVDRRRSMSDLTGEMRAFRLKNWIFGCC
jgi:hypothetical protein